MTLQEAIRNAQTLADNNMSSAWTPEETKQLLKFLKELDLLQQEYITEFWRKLCGSAMKDNPEGKE